MKTAILSVGTELLFGQIVNTNTVYLSQQLNMLGYDVMYHYTVGDNPVRLKEMIEYIFHDCDLIMTTGGLGPTQDDLTKETICETMGDDLVIYDKLMKEIESHFIGKEMPQNNRKQAYFPSRAVIFDNESGTAPGFALEKDGKMIISMPGPPKEMRRMFENEIRPFLEKKQNGVIYYKMIRTLGIEESRIETYLLDLIDSQTDPTIATYAKDTGTMIRVASKRDSIEEAERAVDDMIKKIEEKVGDFIYSTDDEEIETTVGEKLIRDKVTISSAESCTGGMFAEMLTNVPGISEIFEKGFITYSNEAKEEELGVLHDTLEKHGAVSGQTALEMAKGLYEKTDSDICISVTGLAGPDGGTAEKPVGLIYIGVNYRKDINGIKRSGDSGGRIEKVVKIKRSGLTRERNRKNAAVRMFDIVNRILDGRENF